MNMSSTSDGLRFSFLLVFGRRRNKHKNPVSAENKNPFSDDLFAGASSSKGEQHIEHLRNRFSRVGKQCSFTFAINTGFTRYSYLTRCYLK